MPLDTRLRKFSPHVVWLVVLLIALQVRDVAKAVGLPIPKIPVPHGGGIADNFLSVVSCWSQRPCCVLVRQARLQRVWGCVGTVCAARR